MSTNAIVPVDTQQILRTACAVGFQRARMSAIYKYLRGIDPVTGDPNPGGRIERLKVLDQAVDQCLNETRWRDYMLRVMLAGFVSPGLVASTNAITNAYAFYILGTTYGVQRQELEEGVCRWLFGTLLTARYSTSSETKYEEDLGEFAMRQRPTLRRSCRLLTTCLATFSQMTTGTRLFCLRARHSARACPGRAWFPSRTGHSRRQGFVRRSTLAKSACSSRWGRPRGQRNASPFSKGVAP